MSIETTVRCDRCNLLWSEEQDHWMCMEVHCAESGGGMLSGRIDLCGNCEMDLIRFMAGEVFHRFMETK